jgi:hypothetical protein
VVIDVLELYRAAQMGDGVHLASVLAFDPPQLVWQGLEHYRHVAAKIKEHDREIDSKRPKGTK